jgi:hypothetical protein
MAPKLTLNVTDLYFNNHIIHACFIACLCIIVAARYTLQYTSSVHLQHACARARPTTMYYTRRRNYASALGHVLARKQEHWLAMYICPCPPAATPTAPASPTYTRASPGRLRGVFTSVAIASNEELHYSNHAYIYMRP